MEALERRGKLIAILCIIAIVFWSQCKGVSGAHHGNFTKMSYVCPPLFIRLGDSCFFFSETKATWQAALFACKDRDSNLTVPLRWQDKNLRNHLNDSSVEKVSRWIGGIYDDKAREWKWGGELRQMRYQSFSKMKKLKPEQLKWHCIAMMPDLLYRWSPQNCYEPRHYICQTKLLKMTKAQAKELQRKYKDKGKINEITVPSISREEMNDVAQNDVTVTPNRLPPANLRMGPKHDNRVPGSYRPSAAQKKPRSPNATRRLKRPFPGYTWNRKDPEGSFKHNKALLLSGKTGASRQQIKGHLARLSHMRDKQLAKRLPRKGRKRGMLNDQRHIEKRKQRRPQIQVQRTYTIDNNISALHPKMIVEEINMLAPPPPPPPRVVRGFLNG